MGLVDWRGWAFLDWMICGGESGAGARPMHPDWARAARDYCASKKIPFHFKQWGEWYPVNRNELDVYCRWIGGGPAPKITSVDGTDKCGYYCSEEHGHVDHQSYFMKRIGKSRAGRLLDGVEHNGFPEVK